MDAALPPESRLARLFGTWVTEVSRATMRADIAAALPSAVQALPQGIAFASLAGLPPAYGLYSAVIPCVVAALFGSSWHVVSGPTNSISLALFAMLAPLAVVGSPAYIQLALTVTTLVGLVQLGAGLLRLGSIANFISPPALMGFTSGAALLIAVHALKDLMALEVPPGSSAGTVLIQAVQQHAPLRSSALLVGVTTLAAILCARRLSPRCPYMLVGLMVGGCLAWLVNQSGGRVGMASVELVGGLPEVWPPFSVPRLDVDRLPELVGIAFALAIIALAQSVSIAKAVALRSGQAIDTNREIIGQGLSNVAGGFFSSYVSCGSVNRSIPNLELGARTPLAAAFSAGLLVALVTTSSPLLAHIPLAAIAGLLLLVAWTLLDLPGWRKLARSNRTEFGIACGTLVATLVFRLDMAILLGSMASLVVYLQRTSRPSIRSMGFDSTDPQRRFVVIDENHDALPECPQLKLIRMEGSVYFGAAQHVAHRLHGIRTASGGQPHLLVMGKSMNFIDQAGADLWEAELSLRRRVGGDLYFHRPRPSVRQTWEVTGFIERLGRDHVFEDKQSAVAGIVARMDPSVCARCATRIFRDCPASRADLRESVVPKGSGLPLA